MINNEMDSHLVKRGNGKQSRTKYNGTYIENKPYWTDELTKLWKEMKLKESQFLTCVGLKNEKHQLRKEFQSKQWLFDRRLKQCKHTFAQAQQSMLIKSRMQDSKQFWMSIKKLNPA